MINNFERVRVIKDAISRKEMHEKWLEINKDGLCYYQKELRKHKTPGMKPSMEFDRVLMYLQKYESAIQLELHAIEHIDNFLKEMEEVIYGDMSIEEKVEYLKDVKKMKLKDIAETLNYGVDWIKKVSAKLKRQYTFSYTDNIDKIG